MRCANDFIHPHASFPFLSFFLFLFGICFTPSSLTSGDNFQQVGDGEGRWNESGGLMLTLVSYGLSDIC